MNRGEGDDDDDDERAVYAQHNHPMTTQVFTYVPCHDERGERPLVHRARIPLRHPAGQPLVGRVGGPEEVAIAERHHEDAARAIIEELEVGGGLEGLPLLHLALEDRLRRRLPAGGLGWSGGVGGVRRSGVYLCVGGAAASKPRRTTYRSASGMPGVSSSVTSPGRIFSRMITSMATPL